MILADHQIEKAIKKNRSLLTQKFTLLSTVRHRSICAWGTIFESGRIACAPRKV
jgi:hypothetical protein